MPAPESTKPVGQFALLISILHDLQATTGFTVPQILTTATALSVNGLDGSSKEAPRRASVRLPSSGDEEFADTLARVLGDHTMSAKLIVRRLKKERHPVSKIKFPLQAIATVVRKFPQRFERVGRAVYRVRPTNGTIPPVQIENEQLVDGQRRAKKIAATPAKVKKVRKVRKTKKVRAAKKLAKTPSFEEQVRVLKSMSQTFFARDYALKLGIDSSQARGIMHNLHSKGYVSSKKSTKAGGAKVWQPTAKVSEK
jgi:hypothetical protein